MSVAEDFAEGVVIIADSGVEVAGGRIVLRHVEELAPVLVCLVECYRAAGYEDGCCTINILEGLCFDGGRDECIDIHRLHTWAESERVVCHFLHGAGQGNLC